jgi:para-nitrobenzyl esterase
VREASRPGPAAPQLPAPLVSALGLGTDGTSEDCLYLNVWTPSLEGSNRPVFVWIHGGGFASGSASQPVYDGSILARFGDAVLVTLQYRLGALGFLDVSRFDTGEGAAVSNRGLLDLVFALEWVREEIGAFGGDPEQVTVIGESSGAMAVATLLGTPRARGLFQKAILESGAAHHVSTTEQAERVAAAFLEELGNRGEERASFEQIPIDALLEAQQRAAARVVAEITGTPWQPCVDGDLVPAPPLTAVANGSASEIPLVIGTNADEMKLWGIMDRDARRMDEAKLLRRLRRNLPGPKEERADRARKVVEAYRAARQGQASTEPPDLWFAIETDRVFRIPAIRLAEAHANASGQSYAYLFSWPSPAMRGWLGACHTLEIPFVFGTQRIRDLRRFVGAGPEADRLSREIQEAWVAFAREGVPRLPDGQIWPQYESSRRVTARLDRCWEVLEAPLDQEREFWGTWL